MGAQEQRTRGAFWQLEIEGVHIVADGMVLGNIEGLKIVVRLFDFWSFDDGEADGKENVFNFLEDLANQMVCADGTNDTG